MVRRCLVTALSVLLFVVAITASVAQAQTTALRLESDPGDYIGRGLHQTWTTADATFSPSGSASSGLSISVSAGSSYWYLQFAAAHGSSLVTGVYDPAYDTNYGAPRIDVYGSYGTCDVTSGRFVVLEIVFNPNGTLARFAADFEQHCEDADPALLGAVRFNSTIATLTPFDGAPRDVALTVAQPVHGEVTAEGIACGGGNTDCAESFGAPSNVVLTATPDAGYVFLAWTGDCRGGVSPVVVTRVNRGMRCSAWFNTIPGTGGTDSPLAGEAVVYLDGQAGASQFDGQRAVFRSGVGALITVGVARADYIEIELRQAHGGMLSRFSFAAPYGSRLAPKAYEYTISPFRSALFAGMDVSVQGTCNTPRGRFIVHEVSLDGGELRSFSADFEEHCSDEVAGVYGAVRFNATRRSLVPFDAEYPTYHLHVASERGGRVVATGINCGVDCDQTYTDPTAITVTAVPDVDFVFAGWAEDCVGPATTTIAVDRRRRCTAVFSPARGAVTTALDTNTLLFDSQAGDVIGQGQRAIWTGRSSMFGVAVAKPGYVSISVTGSGGNHLFLDFVAPAGEQLTAGRSYEFATRYPFQSDFMPGLYVGTDDRACSALRGRFVVDEIAFDARGWLSSLAVDFEQHCEGQGPALFGALRFNAAKPDLLPFDGAYPIYQFVVGRERGGTVIAPGIDCGADCDETYTHPTIAIVTAIPDPGFRFAAWTHDCTGTATTTISIDQRRRCTAVFSPQAGTLASALDTDTLLLDSDAGDYIGEGKRSIWTGRSSVFEVISATPGMVRIAVARPESEAWELVLAAPWGERLIAGRWYESAARYPLQAAAEPGLSLYTNYGRHCNTLTGRFAVYEIAFAPDGALTALAVDFEQHCDGRIPGLRGSLRYHSSYADLIPYPGEGRSNFLFRHGTTGDLVMWVMGGWTRVASQTPQPSRVGTNWRLVGMGDFNADGKADWLWQEDTAGDLVVWFMDDIARTSYAYLSIPRPADPLWKVASVADMNGDGKPDLVWQHAASGALAAWMMNGTTVVDRVSLDPWVVADANWKVVSTGDFNGDGKTDLLWKHMTNGYLIAWMMNGVTRTSVEWLSPYQLADREWQIAATADLNGDGKMDIVFQHRDGRLVAWLMDGTARTSYQMLSPAYVKDPSWRIIGPR